MTVERIAIIPEFCIRKKKLPVGRPGNFFLSMRCGQEDRVLLYRYQQRVCCREILYMV